MRQKLFVRLKNGELFSATTADRAGLYSLLQPWLVGYKNPYLRLVSTSLMTMYYGGQFPYDCTHVTGRVVSLETSDFALLDVIQFYHTIAEGAAVHQYILALPLDYVRGSMLSRMPTSMLHTMSNYGF